MDKSAMNITELTSITTYDHFIESQVKHFMSRSKGTNNLIVSAEDLKQEASIWFLVTMREQGINAALRHSLCLHHALYDAVRRSYPLHMSYHAFRNRTNYAFVSVDKIKENIASNENVEEAITAKVDAERLYAKLTDREKRIVTMKMEGIPLRKIAQALGISRRMVDYSVRAMRERLAAYSPMMQEK